MFAYFRRFNVPASLIGQDKTRHKCGVGIANKSLAVRGNQKMITYSKCMLLFDRSPPLFSARAQGTPIIADATSKPISHLPYVTVLACCSEFVMHCILRES